MSLTDARLASLNNELLRIRWQIGDIRSTRLKEISAQVPELSTKTHRSGDASAHGRLGNLRGTLPLVERDLAELQRELKTVHGQVQAVMNDPRRTSTVPSGGLGDVIDMTLELITLVIQRIKQSRN